MNLNLAPVQINIDIESISLDREAFYNVCFITENDTAPRTVLVTKLKDLLDNGYDRKSLAYNFCVGVLAQQGINSIYIRAKRTQESFEDAFDADTNLNYYFLSIESKVLAEVIDFNAYVTSSDDYKLQFYSSPNQVSPNRKMVQYYQKSLTDSDLVSLNTTTINNYYLNEAFNTGYDVLAIDTATTEQLQQARIAYPESAWIGLCGNLFPSSVQWLYKYLAKVDIVKDKVIPDLTTTTSLVINNKSTIGSGKTNQGIPIHEQVSMDWVKWAISRTVWNLLYTQEKVNATKGGQDLIVNVIKNVLDTAVTEGMFEEYRILDTQLDRNTNNIKVKFNANLTHTILEAEVNGSLRY